MRVGFGKCALIEKKTSMEFFFYRLDEIVLFCPLSRHFNPISDSHIYFSLSYDIEGLNPPEIPLWSLFKRFLTIHQNPKAEMLFPQSMS